ncbi:MAG: sensor domain-containing diguanylate cyclase [Mycobacteriales bacterium]
MLGLTTASGDPLMQRQVPDDSGVLGRALAVDEPARVAALDRYDVVGRPRRPDLAAIARIAAYIAGAPTAMINMIGATEQWSAAAYGADPEIASVPRSESMCTNTVAARGPLVTALTSGRWDVYAGTPLLTPDGHAIGALCVLDPHDGQMDEVQLGLLADLADQVVSLLELGRFADRLETAALTDALTGLPNRRLLVDRLRLACARAVRGQGQPALLFCDLDRFKAVNDTHGHDVGDEILVEAGLRLQRATRGHDTVARWGGDEFVVLCDPVSRESHPQVVAARLRKMFLSAFATSAGPIHIACSIGVTAWQDGADPETMLIQADRLMYEQKRAGKNDSDIPAAI